MIATGCAAVSSIRYYFENPLVGVGAHDDPTAKRQFDIPCGFVFLYRDVETHGKSSWLFPVPFLFTFPFVSAKMNQKEVDIHGIHYQFPS